MKEIGQGVVGRALKEAGPRVQQSLGDLAVMASFAKPLRELLFGEGVNVLRLFDLFEVQTVWDVILGETFFDFVCSESVETAVVLVHRAGVFVLAPGRGEGEELQEAFYEGATRAQVFNVLFLRCIAATENNQVVTQVTRLPRQTDPFRDLSSCDRLWRGAPVHFGEETVRGTLKQTGTTLDDHFGVGFGDGDGDYVVRCQAKKRFRAAVVAPTTPVGSI